VVFLARHMLSDKRPEPVGDAADRPDEVFDLRPKPLIIRFPSAAVARDTPDILFQRIYLTVQRADKRTNDEELAIKR